MREIACCFLFRICINQGKNYGGVKCIVISKFNELEHALKDSSQIAFVQRIDNVLFSHGGLSKNYVRQLDRKLLDADIDGVLAVINSASPEYLWNDESPLWLRPQYRNVESFRHDKYIQVVGHTPVDRIYEKDGYISTDVFSTYRDGRQIGESAMIVIDSETGKYEKVGVPGKRIVKISTVPIQDYKS